MGAMRESTTISAGPQRVWEAVVDFEARPKWEPRVKQASIVGGGPLREGSRIRLRVDRDTFTSTVVAIEPPGRLVLVVKGPGFRVTHSYELRPEPGGTTLALVGDYQGLMGRLVARFMRKSIHRDLTDELAAIKRAAESSG